MEEERELTILPYGTLVFAPFDRHVTILFPTEEDAILFHEFLRAFVNKEIELEAVEKEEE
jgi:hypothetical protein